MAQDLGTGVSYVNQASGYNYDLVVFQKEKPILDTELNLVQQLQGILNQRQSASLASGWLTMYPFKTDPLLKNSFYSQSTTNPKPEYALVNGLVVHVTNTGTTVDNLNKIDLGAPPSTGNRVNGVFLEVWRALLDPNTSTNKPGPLSVIDRLYEIDMYDEERGWMCGDNGLILATINGGTTWNVQQVDTKNKLNGIYFVSSLIGFTVGDNGYIARTSSGGENWVTLESPTIENLKSVFAHNQILAWAVGDYGTIVKTNNGVTWLTVSSGITKNLRKVYFHDDLIGWAVGEAGTIIKTTNGGTTWFPLNSEVTVDLNSVFFYDVNYGFAVGENGTILKTADGGAHWASMPSGVTLGLNDVFAVPRLDAYIVDEDASSQVTGINKDFITNHTPITKGNGYGTPTNVPTDVKVTVNNVEVAVDSVNGLTGVIVLNAAPPLGTTVKISYYTRTICAMDVWVAGDGGTILKSTDIGASWSSKTSGTSYDLYSIYFVDRNKGWSAGDLSVVRHTEDGGGTWTAQYSSVIVRQVQRIFKEGNVDTSVYLTDDMIHPDSAIETTKRIQIQYRIRVVDGVDPATYPDAGLSTDVKGRGPNSTATYPYQNMGPITGDYGLWQAKCLNTVDGYCWAIPMFFVARRNTTAYNPSTNPNGSYVDGSSNARPDKLLATDVVDADILDVRRKIIVPAAEELLLTEFDKLSNNKCRVELSRQSNGGDRYGTEMLQTDRVAGQVSNGGELIDGATLSMAVAGQISSNSEYHEQTNVLAASNTVPSQYVLPTVNGLYSLNPWDFSAVYVSTSSYNGKQIPGYFEGFGTSSVKFIFSPFANTQITDPSLSQYKFISKWHEVDTISLRYIPSAPKLVKNISGTGSPAIWYQGVLDTDESRVIEEWDSGVAGYRNYALVYPAKDPSDPDQQNRASNVEAHQFITLTSEHIVNVNKIKIRNGRFISVGSSTVTYEIYTISKINNVTSGFSYKISNIEFTDPYLYINSVTGFPFLVGTTIEIVASVVSRANDTGIRNGASVNFTSRTKGIGSFCKSIWKSVSGAPFNPISINIPNSEILGVSTTEMLTSLTQHVCWSTSGGITTMVPISVTGFGTNTINVTVPNPDADYISLQILYKETQLTYNVDGNKDGLLISYNYTPYQTPQSLPTTLSVDILSQPSNLYVSNLGDGGGVSGSPYSNPLEHIPVNDSSITTEGLFRNYDPFRFNNFLVDTGFVKLPVHITDSFNGTLTLSSPVTDSLGRTYYSSCSKEMEFTAEGLLYGVTRKVYLPVIAKVVNSSDAKFLNGERILLIFSRNMSAETENVVGYKTGSKDAIAVYRLSNKPLGRA